jgi:large subunit ribosomal protein L2
VWSSNLAMSLNILKNPLGSAFISLIKYSNGTFSYILAASNLKPGFLTFSTIKPSIFVLQYNDLSCNILLKYMDYTHPFFNVELFVGQGGKYARAAGTFCKILAFNLDKDIIKILLPSGNTKIVSQYCLVTLGRSSNLFHQKEFFCKAGYYRHLGFKSKVRGVAMNPVDHPHGGRTKTNSPEVTPWGKIAKFNK